MEILAKGIALAGCAIGAGLALIAGIGQSNAFSQNFHTIDRKSVV